MTLLFTRTFLRLYVNECTHMSPEGEHWHSPLLLFISELIYENGITIMFKWTPIVTEHLHVISYLIPWYSQQYWIIEKWHERIVKTIWWKQENQNKTDGRQQDKSTDSSNKKNTYTGEKRKHLDFDNRTSCQLAQNNLLCPSVLLHLQPPHIPLITIPQVCCFVVVLHMHTQFSLIDQQNTVHFRV